MSALISTRERNEDEHKRAIRQAYDGLCEVVPEHERARLLAYEAAMTRWAVAIEEAGFEVGVQFGGLVVESEAAERLAFQVLAAALMSGLRGAEAAKALEAVACRLVSAR